ncbi:ABC transporter substrate-binding protein [Streptomyces sp. C10]|uniref:ABC transporter substrate-binding protein n=1 Tax=Streptomyces sp. C10 TaxID=531941 RepID=UPI0039811259
MIVFAATGGGPYGNADPQVLMYRTVHEEPRLDELADSSGSWRRPVWRRSRRGGPLCPPSWLWWAHRARTATGCRSPSPSGGSGPSGNPSAIGTPSGRLPKEIRDKRIVTIGSDISYAPMEFVRDGKPAGLDVELATALSRELGLRVKFVNATFDTLLTGLNVNRFDLVMSAMTDTKDRQEGRTDGTKTGSGVDLVDYFKAGLVLVVRKGNPEGVKALGDLSGRKVAVQRGTFARDYLDQLNPEAPAKLKIREFDSPAEVYDDVAKGRSTACLDDFPVAAHNAATRAGGTALELSGAQLETLLYGIAVAKTNTVLRDAVREALDRLIRNGEYAKILKKWHVEDGSVERAVVNGGP